MKLSSVETETEEEEYIRKHHKHQLEEDNQCTSILLKHINAPIHLVWSLVRRFDQPEMYKPFISRCCVVKGNHLDIGSVREINVKSGLPATTSTERLEFIDDNDHILCVKILGGDHRLKNYSSIISLHPEEEINGTLVIESFIVDAPEGNTKDETCFFVKALINCNLNSLAAVSERLRLAAQQDQPPTPSLLLN